MLSAVSGPSRRLSGTCGRFWKCYGHALRRSLLDKGLSLGQAGHEPGSALQLLSTVSCQAPD